jgi:hypothetical protein
MRDRAAAAGAPDLDLDAIIAAGDRRVRRRRVAVGVGVTAALVAVVVSVPAIVDRASLGDKDIQPTNPTGTFATRTTTYAVGSTIYYGDDAIDVSPHDVSALVQTDYGFVFTSTKGDHQDVWFTDATGTDKIGETVQDQGTLLAADDSGPYVEWLDTASGSTPEFVVYDTNTGKEVARTNEGNLPLDPVKDEFDVTRVHAIDGTTAYWHSSEGTVAYDIEAGSQQVLRAHTSASYLFDVSNGLFAFSSFDDLSTVVSRDLGADDPFVPGIGEPQLSPYGSYVATAPAQLTKIFETATQDDVTPDAKGYRTVLITQWIDDEQYAAIGTKGDNIYRGPVAQLVCSITTGTCEEDRASIGTLDELVFPVGGNLTDR